MKKIVLQSALLLVSKCLFGQAIKGTVTDEKTHQPVAFATVNLLNVADSSQVKGALAGEKGDFQLANLKDGDYLLSVQMIGYTKRIVPVKASAEVTNITIALTPDVKQLGEVSIKASKPLIEKFADKLIFNAENRPVATGNNSLELLKMTPLVTIGNDNIPKLKGKDNVIVMLDGKNVPQAAFESLLESMPAEQISKIEVITNPSAKYDAAATGGIINIITKKGTRMGLNGTADFSAAQSANSKFSTGILLNYRNNKINLYSSLNLRDGKGYRNESINRLLETENGLQTLETTTFLKRHGKAESGKLGLDYSISKNSILGLSIDCYFTKSDGRALAISRFKDGADDLDSTLTTYSRPGRINDYTSYNLFYKNSFSSKGEELTININEIRFSGLTTQDIVAQMTTPDTIRRTGYSSDNRTKSLYHIATFQVDYSLPVNSRTLLESGMKDFYTNSNNWSDYTEVNGLSDAQNLSITSYSENILAAYINISEQVKNLKLQSGIRGEQTDAKLTNTSLDKRYINFFPSALISNRFSDNYQLSLSYTGRINRPAYESLMPFVIPIDRYTQEKGNPVLKPEYANSVEITAMIRGLIATLGYTHTNNAITDFINQDQQTKVWTFSKGNFNRLENYSFTLIIPVAVTSWWNTENTVLGVFKSYFDNNVGGAIYDHGKLGYTLNSLNTFRLPGNIKAELSGFYNSANIDGLYQISHTSMVNLGISRLFFQKKLNLKLAVNDIFHDSGYYVASNAGSIHMSSSQYTDSRQVTFGISYIFGGKVTPAKSTNQEAVKNRLNL